MKDGIRNELFWKIVRDEFPSIKMVPNVSYGPTAGNIKATPEECRFMGK